MKTISKMAALFLFIAAAAVAGAASRVQEWEYATLTYIHTPKQNNAVLNFPTVQLTVEVRQAPASNEFYRAHFRRLPEAENDKRDATPSVIDLLNLDFGSRGWELVFVQNDEIFTVYTFKRKTEN